MDNHEQITQNNDSPDWEKLGETEPRFELENRVAEKFNEPKRKDMLKGAIAALMLTAAMLSRDETNVNNKTPVPIEAVYMDEEETKIINENQNIEPEPELRPTPTPPFPPKQEENENVSPKDVVSMPNNDESQMQYDSPLGGPDTHRPDTIDTPDDF